METRKAFWRKIQRIFCSHSPLRMRSAFGKKSEHFFEKLSSHFTTEDLRAVWAKNRNTFLKIFLFTLTTGDQFPVWPNTVDFFSLHLPHLPPDMKSAFGRKNRKLFSKISDPTHYWRRDAQVVRFSEVFSSSLTWEKCQPPLFYYPLEEKRLSERKSGLLSKAFLTDLSGQEKVNWPKKSENREKAAISQNPFL